jgi:hypothetical protein
MPEMHPATAAPLLNSVSAFAEPEILFFHFDAARIHETIIAHELGHVWIDRVLGVEDHRQIRDKSDIGRSGQLSRIQSFVLDLLINDTIGSRSFDMSIISQHQAESIVSMAAHCAKGDRAFNAHAEAEMAPAIAAAMLDRDNRPESFSISLGSSFEMIRICLPRAYEAAIVFVESVRKHGYSDSDSLRRVVDDCAKIAFSISGNGIDLENDLIVVEHDHKPRDKYPGFLRQLPLDMKMDVYRNTARLGVTAGRYMICRLTWAGMRPCL